MSAAPIFITRTPEERDDSRRAHEEILHRRGGLTMAEVAALPAPPPEVGSAGYALSHLAAMQPAARLEAAQVSLRGRIDNARIHLWELVDLLDSASGEHEASPRQLGDSLRMVEVELDNAVQRLAGQLGLVEL